MKEAAGPETVCRSARYASYTATAARRREICNAPRMGGRTARAPRQFLTHMKCVL